MTMTIHARTCDILCRMVSCICRVIYRGGLKSPPINDHLYDHDDSCTNMRHLVQNGFMYMYIQKKTKKARVLSQSLGIWDLSLNKRVQDRVRGSTLAIELVDRSLATATLVSNGVARIVRLELSEMSV